MSQYDGLCSMLIASADYPYDGRAPSMLLKAAAAIRKLQLHLAAARDARDAWERSFVERGKTMAELEADRDALRADAERYRWLRDRHEYNVAASHIVQEVSGEGWDAAIDAALREVK